MNVSKIIHLHKLEAKKVSVFWRLIQYVCRSAIQILICDQIMHFEI